MVKQRFSRRFGHSQGERAITVREDAPEEMRGALLAIAKEELELRPSAVREVLCAVLRKLPDSSNWSAPNVWAECQNLIEGCAWYRVYDFTEALHEKLTEASGPELASRWEAAVNEYFQEAGVGWKMLEGQLETRGPESFESVVKGASAALDEARLPTARDEIHEALRDLSRRPDPDITGAVQHAMGALECTAREAVGDRNATLGEVLKRYPGLLPRPLDEAVSKAWGYASEAARHVREGGTPSREEAELIVGIAATTCTYLAAKFQKG